MNYLLRQYETYYEGKTWGEIFQMLRDKTEELGRAPQKKEIPYADALICGMRYGGWDLLMRHAGVYYRAGESEHSQCPTYMADFTDKQLGGCVRKTSWKLKRMFKVDELWCYPECIRRWGTWENIFIQSKMKVPQNYIPIHPFFSHPCLRGGRGIWLDRI